MRRETVITAEIVKKSNSIFKAVPTLNVMPLPIAEIVRLIRLERSSDGSFSVFNSQPYDTVQHLQHQIVTFALHGEYQAGDIPRLNIHLDVDLQSDLKLIF